MLLSILFYLTSFILIASSVKVVSTPNKPVTAILCLIATFLSAATLWLLLGAEFLALLLTLIYVGAVMVLFLFMIMMLDTRTTTSYQNLRRNLIPGLIAGTIITVEILSVLYLTWHNLGDSIPDTASINNTKLVGVTLYTQYAYAIEIGAVLLLVGMIAAIVLTLRQRNDTKYNNTTAAVMTKARDRLHIAKFYPYSKEKSSPNP